MPEWLVIARREFLERVRTVWFLVVTVLGPVLMTGLLVVPAWLASRSADEKVVIAVVDRSGRNVFPMLDFTARQQKSAFILESVSPDVAEELLLRRIREQKIAGYLVVPAGVLTGKPAEYRGENATNFRVLSLLTQALTQAAMRIRAKDANIPDETLFGLFVPIEINARHDTGRGDTSSAEASFVAGYATMFVLYMAILLYAVNVMRSVIQEKTNRVVEVVVSSVKPRDLMLGKVLGVGAVGLLQLAIWAGIALALVTFNREVLGLFGIAGAAEVEMPPLGFLDVVVILVYFALGYFFYAALYAAIGAMVNTEQEAQQLQSPIVILLIIPVLCVQLVANQPRGGATQFLTHFPFSSPVLMPMRYLLGGVDWGEIAVSIAVLLASIGLAVALAGRIYRVGILMYGKRPSLRELARWIRYS